jgi:hypothetical protein
MEQIASVTQPANGTAAVTGGGSEVSYTPAADYCNSRPVGASDNFTYKLDRGSEATVAVTVNCAPSSGLVVPPRLGISHRAVPLVRGQVVLRLLCGGERGQHCAGTLTLKATSLGSRLTAAATSRRGFSIAAGSSKTVRVTAPSTLRAIVRRRGKAVAQLTARMRGDGAAREPLKRLITVHARR